MMGTSRRLDRPVRDDLGRRLGFDFSAVRLHDDAAAHRTAVALGAKAFTSGSDVVFGKGQFAPQTSEGRRLLAHELAHVVQHSGAHSGLAGRSVSQRSDALEDEARGAADAVAAGVAAEPVRPSSAAVGSIHRDVINDRVSGNPVAFEFRVGTELTKSFMELAQRLLGGGVLHARGLRALRDHAIARDGTLDDHERMFMAALMDPAGAAVLRPVAVGPGTSVTFAFSTIVPNLPTVIDLDRAAPQVGPSAPPVERQIRRHAERFAAQADRLILFAAAAGVPLTDVLSAMLAAASDNTAGDQVLAGSVYAVAAAASHPLAADLLAGSSKVDALLPAAFARLPKPAAVAAFYVTAAQVTGLKGDTLYFSTAFDINDLHQRSAVIHELAHATDDRAAGAVTTRPTDRLEAAGYRAQGRFLLEQLDAQFAVNRAASATRLAHQLSDLELLGMLVEALSDRPRFEPVLVAIAAGSKPARSAADVAALLNRGGPALEAALLARIAARYVMTPGQQTIVEGQSGESITDWIFRI